MTPQQAAARCREMAEQHDSMLATHVTDAPTFHRLMGTASGLKHAAALIETINQPQPWPPPEDVRECHAFSIAHKKWIYVSGELCRCTGYTHWLPMPASPEVKG